MLQTERTYQTTRYTQQKRACKRTSVSVRKRITRQRLQSIALELVWPTRCAICDAPGVLVCDTCKQALRFWDPWLACATCGAPFGFVQCCECNSYTQEKRTEHTAPLYCSSSVLFNDETYVVFYPFFMRVDISVLFDKQVFNKIHSTKYYCIKQYHKYKLPT